MNQSASWVAAIPTGPEPRVGTSRIVRAPRTSIRPIACAWLSVNHSAPSGPVVIIAGNDPGGERELGDLAADA